MHIRFVGRLFHSRSIVKDAGLARAVRTQSLRVDENTSRNRFYSVDGL